MDDGTRALVPGGSCGRGSGKNETRLRRPPHPPPIVPTRTTPLYYHDLGSGIGLRPPRGRSDEVTGPGRSPRRVGCVVSGEVVSGMVNGVSGLGLNVLETRSCQSQSVSLKVSGKYFSLRKGFTWIIGHLRSTNVPPLSSRAGNGHSQAPCRLRRNPLSLCRSVEGGRVTKAGTQDGSRLLSSPTPSS